MKHVTRTILLALLAALALGALTASVALASPEWYVKKAGSFKKVTTGMKVKMENQFELIDTKHEIAGERLAVACTSEDKGEISASGKGTISEFVVSEPLHKCKGIDGEPPLCERLTTDVGVGLPWNTELYSEGSEIRRRITSSLAAWAFTCENVVFGKLGDECGANTSTHMTNNATGGFVEATFDAKSKKTKCEKGGAESGEWKGVLKIKATEAGVEAIKVE